MQLQFYLFFKVFAFRKHKDDSGRGDKVLGHIQTTLHPHSLTVIYFRWEHINVFHIANFSGTKFDNLKNYKDIYTLTTANYWIFFLHAVSINKNV